MAPAAAESRQNIVVRFMVVALILRTPAIIKRLSIRRPLRYGSDSLGAGRTAAASAVGNALRGVPSAGRGKSGLQRTEWSVTPTGRKARESATESRPPRVAQSPRLMAAAVRVKRCGKSAPAAGATRLAWQTPPGARPNMSVRAVRRAGWSGPFDARVGCWRRRV